MAPIQLLNDCVAYSTATPASECCAMPMRAMTWRRNRPSALGSRAPWRRDLSDFSKPLHDLAIAIGHLRVRSMDAVFDHSLAADDDRLYQPPSRDEHIFIEPQITATPAQIRMVAIEHDDVGSPTRRDRADRAPERLGAAGERVCIKTA